MIAIAVRKQLGEFSLDAAFASAGGTTVLYGESGSGKSVTLQAIAGLLRPDSGAIRIGERTVFDSAAGIDEPPHHRNLGYVVQQLALFPHLTAEENITYALTDATDADRRRRLEELLALLSLEGLERHLPRQLSGGQQQRVALARALARPVDALLLDEPFSALDESLRADLRAELLRIRSELAIPIVFVTHDLREAYLLADSVAVIDDGRVLQHGSKEDVFQRPTSRRVAQLTGVRNIFRGQIEGEGKVTIDALPLHAAIPAGVSGTVDVAIRAERCILRRLDPEGELPPNCYAATIVSELAFGNTHTLRLDPDGRGPSVEVEVPSRPYDVLGIAAQRRWVVELPPEDLRVMPAAGPRGMSEAQRVTPPGL